jgi:hypothetical protein
MKRPVQALLILLCMLSITAAVLAMAVAWGPHHCALKFPKIVGCALASYEGLSGGLIAGAAAIFAGWIAWVAVQTQIAAEEKRSLADRAEVESLLMADMDVGAEALAAIWTVMDTLDDTTPPDEKRKALEAVFYGIEEITQPAWISSSRNMASTLGWKRRREYEELIQGLETLAKFRGNYDVELYDIERELKPISYAFQNCRPDTSAYFDGFFRRAGKASTLGYSIQKAAGIDPDAIAIDATSSPAATPDDDIIESRHRIFLQRLFGSNKEGP